jgi:hypothetical protein
MAPAIPGDHDMRINKGLLLVISPKIATTWSVNKISRAAIPQLKPKVIARNGIRVLVFMILSPSWLFLISVTVYSFMRLLSPIGR